MHSLLAPLFLSLAVLSGSLPAQEPPSPPAQATAEDRVSMATLEELVATIQDPAARQKLVDQLQALIEARKAQAGEPAEDRGVLAELAAFLTTLSDEVGQTAVALIDQLRLLPQRASSFWDRLQDPEQRRVILSDTGMLGGVLLVGLAAAVFVWYLTRRSRTRLGSRTVRGPIVRVFRAVAVLLLDLLAPAALVAVTFVGLSMLAATQSGAALTLALMSAIAVKWSAKAVLRFLLAPAAGNIRILPLADSLAQPLARSIDRLLSLGIYGFFALEAVAAAGADAGLLEPLRSLYGLLLLFAGIFVVLRYRRVGREADVLRVPPSEGALPRWRKATSAVLGLWWIGAIVYLVGIYTVWMSRIEGGFAFALQATALTAAVLMGAGLAIVVLRWLVGALGRHAESLLGRVPVLARRVPRYVRVFRLVLDVAVLLFAAGLVLDAWGIAALDALTSPGMRGVLGDLLNMLLVVLIAAALIDVAGAFTQGYLTRSEKTGRASGKVKTLVPLAQKTIKFFVVVIAGVTILGQLGMDIGPILAGVGVLGLAIGFGAQTLVKDVITGAFMLIEDSVAVGDVVQVDDSGGVVEAINIRTIRLRDISGNVHTIPYSSVGKVTNLTKDFSRYLIEAGVAYREDVDEVIALLKELGEELRKDPVLGPDIIEPIEILGLDRFEDSAVIVRARLITRPARQWAVGREFNRRMKRAFDERGIEIPFPHRTVYMGQDKQGQAPPLLVEKVARTLEAPDPG